jgi:hypothetical protein
VAVPILHLNDTPEAVALGTALGVFIAMTPTVGIQMLMVLVVHTIFRANRLAGILMVYLSNPLTLIPIYWLDYVVGSVILGRQLYTYEAFTERARVVHELVDRWEFWEVTRQFVEVSGDLAGPTLLGGCVVGTVLAVPCYFLTRAGVRAHRARRAAKRGETTRSLR